ncbi:RNA polymerase sigma-70 factor (ECF subfamily) [Nocardioides marinisabuli]|uniref:RNA polymerase sigma factor n=1 Tax=Nocardioides marinisabuli TaxID=419476 RepID=A0A7Y9EZ72_9ACTN|nr:sigma-70 family RNA polymerase sigma factor [Nocardioides marinisabuli]NYD56669.1 RNA polymerase sigma-70 factor (ECF subfamily) [Nocardioides marinisabuli]
MTPSDGKEQQGPAGSEDMTPAATHPTTGDPAAARAEAFARWVEPEVEVLLRVAHTLTGSWSDADDVVQDTLVRAWRAADRFDGRHPRAWLLTILRRTHLNSLRRTRPDLVGDDVLTTRRPAFGSARAASPEQIVDEQGFDADVAAALAGLGEQFRRAVLLVDVDHLTYEEAAAALDVPVGTVVSRVSRGRSRLRAALAHRRPAGGA